MVLMTIIARVSDGLPLVASVQDNTQVGKVVDYQNRTKQLLKKLASDTPRQLTLEEGQFFYHLLTEHGVCYLTLCEKSFSKRLAYNYLEDLQNEFTNKYGSRINSVTRPYSFIEFDSYLQKAKKSIMDSRAKRNLAMINSELQNVQRIMVQNIDDVLHRGAAISDLDSKASNLSLMSQKYRKDARYLNLKSAYAKAAYAVGAMIFVVILYFWIL